MIALLGSLASISGARFASFRYVAKGTGEDATYRVRLGVNVRNMYEKDAAFVRALVSDVVPGSLRWQAAKAILKSLEESLEKGIGNNSAYTHGGDDPTYVSLDGVPGVKVHRENGSIHLLCVVDNKTVHTPGVYKVVNSADLTIEKNKIRKLLRTGKLRQFVLPNISRAALNGNVLELS